MFEPKAVFEPKAEDKKPAPKKDEPKPAKSAKKPAKKPKDKKEKKEHKATPEVQKPHPDQKQEPKEDSLPGGSPYDHYYPGGSPGFLEHYGSWDNDHAYRDMHYSTYHYTHPELDHHYDDAHDVTPVPFHEHAVLKAVHSPDRLSYESMPFNEAKPQEDNPMHVSPLDMHYSIYHPTHRSLDHHYDDAHDVTPVPFHEHRVLKAVDPDHPSEFDVTESTPFTVHHDMPYHHEAYHYYPNKANKSSKSENWMPLHHAMPHHHNPDMHYSTYHYTHPELDHHYDDAHDVTPVPFHEHAVLKSVHSPDRLSYESMTPYYERHHYAN